MRKAAAMSGLAAFAVALALPAFGEEGATYEASAGHRSGDSNAFHASALDPADQALADRIVDALRRDKKVHNSPVTVWANRGDITLIGPIDNAQTVSQIEQVAIRVAGRGHVFPMV